MNKDVDILSKGHLWPQIHAEATHQPHKAIYRDIKTTTMEYHNIKYTITSHLAKTIKNIIYKYRSLKYWSSHNRDIYNVITDISVFQNAAKNLPILKIWWLSKWSCGMCRVGKWLECCKDHNHSK